MQTLFIPDKIQIDFFDSNNNPLHQDKILIGIRTFANHKNDIDLSPFLTDSLGSLTITSADIKKNLLQQDNNIFRRLNACKRRLEQT